ncbi:DM13 domain-containing protein [Sinomonas halotolerans]|uniref:DM13 domain-containing protein n=1 Tax=Sinomonas halotolerans TaxID=1644133 RepID=A0ABU9WWS5_9MICC
MDVAASLRHAVRRHPVLSATAGIVAAAALAIALYLFQPWRLFTSSTLVEAVPTATAPATPPAADAPTGGPTTASSGKAPATSAPPAATSVPSPATSAPPAGPRVLARGQVISHEHPSSGTAIILELQDGSRILRFEGLDTSDGPDLRVWLTDAPVIEGPAGWHVFDDGRYLDLGELKANKGDQNYAIPAEADLGDLTSVSVWCRRFAVSFGAASLAAA